MEITKKVDGNTTMISLKGRLDTITSGQLESEMKNVLQEGLSNLVFDFSELDYISSSGLRVMLTTQKKVDEIEAKMKITNVNEFVRGVFEATGFTRIMDLS